MSPVSSPASERLLTSLIRASSASSCFVCRTLSACRARIIFTSCSANPAVASEGWLFCMERSACTSCSAIANGVCATSRGAWLGRFVVLLFVFLLFLVCSWTGRFGRTSCRLPLLPLLCFRSLYRKLRHGFCFYFLPPCEAMSLCCQ